MIFIRGQVVVPYPIDTVFDRILESCKQVKAKIKNADRSRYHIEGKSPTTMLRFGQKMHILLRQELGNTVIEVYENSFYGQDLRFIIPLLTDLAKRMPFDSNFKVGFVKEMGEEPKREIHTLTAYSSRKPIPSSISNPNLCESCNTIQSRMFDFHSQKLCLNCFQTKYGRLVLLAPRAEYFGGHKAYLAGGMFKQYQSGKMYLTENYLLFDSIDKTPSNKWEIMIPLGAVNLEGWNIEEVSRRKQISAGDIAVTSNVGFIGGAVHDSGKAHHLVVPYTDENGISQEPRFGVSSYGGKAIREWALKLYENVVKRKKTVLNNSISKEQVREPMAPDDPLHILKLRFVKGEITKEEFEEMRKTIES